MYMRQPTSTISVPAAAHQRYRRLIERTGLRSAVLFERLLAIGEREIAALVQLTESSVKSPRRAPPRAAV